MTNCESCVNYVYDDDYEYYVCLVDLDEDEVYNFVHGNTRECPYYRIDEYGVVKYQM